MVISGRSARRSHNERSCSLSRSSGTVGAHHFLADLTLPYGRVVYDYNKQDEGLAEAAE